MNRIRALAGCLLFLIVLGSASAHAAGRGDWAPVDRALGREGKDFPGGVHKVGFPRFGNPEQLARGLSSALGLIHVKRQT